MSITVADRVRETSTTSGTGSITLLGPITGYQAWADGIGNSVDSYYCIVDNTNGDWEVGIGDLSGDTVLARTVVLSSSNDDLPVSFAGGTTKDVYCSVPASYFNTLNTSVEDSLASIDGKTVHVDTDDVTVTSSVLPTGAATESTVSSLDSKVTACNTGAVTVTSSVLPTGAATESTVSSINSKVTACNTGAVTVSSSSLPTGAATETTLSSLNTTVAGTVTSGRQAVNIIAGQTGVSGGAGTVAANTQRIAIATDANAVVASAGTNLNTSLLALEAGGNLSTLAGTVSQIGSVTETAPSTDVASSGLNGRLQRVAQRLTSVLGLFPTAAALGDAIANPIATLMGSCNMLWDGTQWRRQRCNTQTIGLTLAARTVNTSTSPTTNYHAKGIVVYLHVTAVPAAPGAGGLSVAVIGINADGTGGTQLNASPTKVTAIGDYSYEIYPGSSGGATGTVVQRTAGLLPGQFYVYVGHLDAQSYTYSLQYDLMN